MSFLVGPDSFRGSRGFYNKQTKKKDIKNSEGTAWFDRQVILPHLCYYGQF